MMQSSPPASPTVALACPWCNAPSSPCFGPQTKVCEACHRKLTLTLGPAQDPSVVVPPPHPNAFPINLKWSILVTYKFARLDPGGVTSGTLDPVVGLAPIDQVGIAWPDVVSIAVWRKVGWVDCVIGALVPAPVAALCAWAAVATVTKAPGVAGVFIVLAIVFGLVAVHLFRRGLVIGKRQMRIVGRYGSMTVPFSDSPAFHSEIFRRCGLPPPPIP
jgi:hypothetical protein